MGSESKGLENRDGWVKTHLKNCLANPWRKKIQISLLVLFALAFLVSTVSFYYYGIFYKKLVLVLSIAAFLLLESSFGAYYFGKKILAAKDTEKPRLSSDVFNWLVFSLSVFWLSLSFILLLLLTEIWLFTEKPEHVVGKAIPLALTLTGGLGGVVYLVVRYRQQEVNEETARLETKKAKVEEENKDSEFFIASVNLLDKEDPTVKTTGFFRLAEYADIISRKHPEDARRVKQQVVDVFCNYMRITSTNIAQNQETGNTEGTNQAEETTLSTEYRTLANLQRTVISLIREHTKTRQSDSEISWSECSFDFSETTFLVPIDLSECTFKKAVNFTGATFTGRTFFRNAKFNESTYFNNATFTGPTDFSNATFTGHTDFSNATFTTNTYFWDATFTGPTDFSNATFNESTYFWDATFTGPTDFSYATFNESTYFSNATFTTNTYFWDATFTGPTDFSDAKYNRIILQIDEENKEHIHLKNSVVNADSYADSPEKLEKLKTMGFIAVPKEEFRKLTEDGSEEREAFLRGEYDFGESDEEKA
ncbi:pentapeptide repeat-containing protein [Actinomycetaceae bacterium TAE3-ERU4]|nr:pentapeptide repeat-containing protein [Actinomycetaceae bacterium TAE3-ERU4]